MHFSSILILFLAASESGGLGLATANKDKAGKVSEEVSLHRHRERQHQHQCDSISMAPFKGSFVYQGGCGGNSFEVSITCENKGRKEERRNGVMCTFYEETLVSLCV